MSKVLKIEADKAKKLYATASQEIKEIFEETFGKDFFLKKKIQDRIKTFDDVLNELGFIGAEVLPFRCPNTKNEKAINAFAKIQLISEVLNEGWIPDWTDTNQCKYYSYFERKSSGWVVYGCYFQGCDASVGSGLYFKSSELAIYAGNQFIDIYKEYLP